MLRYKYNPQNASREELQATFTAREMMLSRLLNELKQEIGNNTNQHYLVIGPRGIGKTNFLRMIYFGIHDDRRLAKNCLPLQFAEEEYSINSLRDFLTKIVETLFEETRDPEIGDTAKRFHENADDNVVVASALSYLEDYASTTKVRLILLLDNLDLILGDQWKKKPEIKHLRDILMNKNFLKIIGAAPTYFDEVAKYSEPFYNFFKTINLEELTDDQVEELLKRRATFDGNTKLLERLPVERPKLRAIRHLTGGNPRLVLMLYELLAVSELKQVKDYLQTLLDDLTPYYQYKLRWLSAQQRKIIDSMVKLDKAASPTEIAKATRLHVNIVSTNLKRLMEWGYVKLPEQAKRKATYYIISERLFRIWHQMRISTSARKKIEFFVEFIQIWYSLDELRVEAERLTKGFQDYVSLKDLVRAKEIIEHLDYIAEASTHKAFRDRLTDRTINMLLAGLGDLDSAEKKLKEMLCECKKTKDTRKLGSCCYRLGLVYQLKNDHEQALTNFKEAIDANPQHREAWLGAGVSLTNLNRHAEALNFLDQALKLNPTDVSVWIVRGVTLAVLGQLRDAVKSFDEAVRIEPANDEAWILRGRALSELQDFSGAIESFDKAIAIRSENHEAWSRRGFALFQSQRYEEAITSLDTALKLKPDDRKSWDLRGSALFMMERWDEARESLSKALHYSRTDDDAQSPLLGLMITHLQLWLVDFENSNIGSAKKNLEAAWSYYTRIKRADLKELCQKALVLSLQTIVSFQDVELAAEFLSTIEHVELGEEAAILRPFKIALEYLEKNRDPEVLDRLNPEVREVVEDIIKKADEAKKEEPS